MKRKNKTRFICRAAAMSLAFMLTACGMASIDTDQPGGGKWRDSGLVGSIDSSETITEQDDFAAAVNKDFNLNAKLGDGSFYNASEVLMEKKKEIVDSLSDTGEEGELKKYAELASDWEKRNREGAEPLRKYLEAIEKIGTIDDLTAYLASEEDNPFALGLLVFEGSKQSLADPTLYNLVIGVPELSLGSDSEYFSITPAGCEKMENTEKLVGHILGKLGYSDKRIKSLLSGNYRFEKKLAGCCFVTTDTDEKRMLVDYETCIANAGAYPMREILESRGVPQNGKISMNDKSAQKVSAMYTQKNLEDIKAMLEINTVIKAARYLDKETLDMMDEMAVSRLEKPSEQPDYDEETEERMRLFGFYIASSALEPILDRLYIEKYVSDDDIGELEDLTEDIIDEYRTIFANEPWLSDEGKTLCLEKLDNIVAHVIVPDFDMLDYSNLHITAAKDGGNFLDAQACSTSFMIRENCKLCALPFDRERWFPIAPSTTQVNAFYLGNGNAIYILAGVVTDPIYTPDMSYEEKLGGIGTIIGHEITHGFDTYGAGYDKNGVEKKWMPLMDQLAFADACTKVSEYYSTVRPFAGGSSYNGTQVSAEATADMGGLKVTLALAAKEKDFDYDKYFRQYAKLWRGVGSEYSERYLFQNDEHPLNYLRINIGVQQFEEFYKTYDIKENDGMYLAEDKRIAVW